MTRCSALFVLLFLAVAAPAPERLVEVKVAGPDGAVRALTRAELGRVRLVDERAYLDLAWYAEAQEFARRREAPAKPAVVAYGGRGVYPLSLKAVVRRLDEARIACGVVFADSPPVAAHVVVVVPGGWAPSIRDGMGKARLAELRRNPVLGICAGAYLLCSEVVWEGRRYSYPVARIDGVARGPLPELAPWPRAARVELDAGHEVVYAGGAAFEAKRVRVRARYPDGSAAVVSQGRAVLSGVHCEVGGKRDAVLLRSAGWPVAGDGRLFVELVRELAPGN